MLQQQLSDKFLRHFVLCLNFFSSCPTFDACRHYKFECFLLSGAQSMNHFVTPPPKLEALETYIDHIFL
jgi:hypothetical protein